MTSSWSTFTAATELQLRPRWTRAQIMSRTPDRVNPVPTAEQISHDALGTIRFVNQANGTNGPASNAAAPQISTEFTTRGSLAWPRSVTFTSRERAIQTAINASHIP